MTKEVDEIKVLKQNAKQLQEQLQEAYKRINGLIQERDELRKSITGR